MSNWSYVTVCTLSPTEWSVHYNNSMTLHTAPLAVDRYHLGFMYLSTSFTVTTAQNFDGVGILWHFWQFLSKLSLQCLQMHSERQWSSIKILSVKYLKYHYPSKVPTIKILCYTVFVINVTLAEHIIVVCCMYMHVVMLCICARACADG